MITNHILPGFKIAYLGIVVSRYDVKLFQTENYTSSIKHTNVMVLLEDEDA